MTFNSFKRLDELVSEQSDNNNIAIIDSADDSSISYVELNKEIEQAADELRALGIRRGDSVAIEACKTIGSLILAMAVMRNECVCVPLDPQLPAKRLLNILSICKPALIAVEYFSTEGLAAEGDSVTLSSTRLPFVIYRLGDHQSTYDAKESLLAYIIFTSGSTGVPKGVQISHDSVFAFLEGVREKVDYQSPLNFLCVSPFFFDASVLDIYMTFALGGKLVLLPKVLFANQITKALEKYAITDTLMVSSILKMLVGRFSDLSERQLSSLRTIWYGAESCDVDVLKQINELIPGIRFIHGYGPTEATHTALMHVEDGAALAKRKEVYLPIGLPLKYIDIKVVDDNVTEITGEGQSGELLISGPQLMRGYINNPEKDQSAHIYIDSVRYYRSNDIVRLGENGDYYFVGRRDDAVKIMGNLVHLSEVEKSALSIPAVNTAIAMTFEANDVGIVRNSIVLFIASHLGVDEEAVFDQIKTDLPDYMKPRHIVVYEDLADYRLPTGKFDKKHLLGDWLATQSEGAVSA